jgi:hypothetical protein
MSVLKKFSTPAFIQEAAFNPAQQAQMNDLWSENVEGFTQQAITGDPWNNLNAPIQSSYYDPTKTDIPGGTSAAPVTWIAFPNRLNEYLGQAQAPPNPYNLTQQQLFEIADTGYYTENGQQKSLPGIPQTLCPQPDWSGSLHTYGPYGPRGWQDEYCEFSVTRDPSSGKITRVDIICENPEYWYTLWRVSPEAAAKTYQDTLNYGLPTGSPNAITVKVEDLQLTDASGKPVIDPSTGRPAYNPLNKWNAGPVSKRGANASGGAIHLTSTPNTLQTELGLAGGATVLRTVGNSNPQQLICCSQYGQSFRNSDPHIGQNVNQVVSAGFNVSLANPPGLYIQMPDFSGYKLPPDPHLPAGAQPSDCWQVVRGAAIVTDPVTGQPFNGNMMLHVAFQIPAAWIAAGVTFTVGDITINLNGVAQPIQYASQILTTFHIGLFARPLTAQQPKPIACVVNLPNGNQAAQAQPVQMFYRDIWNAYYSTQVNNPAGVSMSLASNTVIVPPRAAQGASNLQMALTCSTAVTGSGGQLPSVTVPERDIAIKVLGMTNVNYAAPGNSYPSDFQLLFLNVTVDRNAAPGARSIVLTNPPQSGNAPPPAVPAPAFLYVLPAIDGARSNSSSGS